MIDSFVVLYLSPVNRQAMLGTKICLSRLSASRYITVPRSHRLPPFIGNRAYNNPSFSVPPSNSISEKIWYRKDGLPRSKWKGMLFVGAVSFSCFAYVVYKTRKELLAKQKALIILVRIQQASRGSSIPDLSTPKGAIGHLMTFATWAADPKKRRIVEKEMPAFVNLVMADPERSKAAHALAKDACNRAYGFLSLLEKPGVQVEEVALDLRRCLGSTLKTIHGILSGELSAEDMKDIVESLDTDQKRQQGDDIIDID